MKKYKIKLTDGTEDTVTAASVHVSEKMLTFKDDGGNEVGQYAAGYWQAWCIDEVAGT